VVPIPEPAFYDFLMIIPAAGNRQPEEISEQK
jgi:hypothetical protein